MSTPTATATDYELLEQLLDTLATPLSRYHTARATLTRLQIDQTASLRRLTGAIDSANGQLATVHQAIMQYADLIVSADTHAGQADADERHRLGIST